MLLAIVLLVLVVGPLVVLLHTSLLPPSAIPLSNLPLGLTNFVTVFTQPNSLLLVTNTLTYAVGSVCLSICIAGIIAWLVERTDLPLTNVVRVLMFSWMAVPPLVMAFGWILLLNPGNGVLNVALKSLLNLDESPLTVYSMSAMILMTGLSLVPTTFVILAGNLRNMDPQLENAALASGASRLTIMRRVTLPLMRPGLLSVAIYLLVVMVQAFEVPLAIGLTAQVPVLSTRIYVLTSGTDGAPDYGLSAAFGVVMLAFAMVLIQIYFRAIRAAERFRVVSGKAYRPKLVELGRMRGTASVFVALYFGFMLMPLLILLWTSLLPFYQTPTLSALSLVSLERYADVLSQSTVHKALVNTLILVLTSATLTMILSGLIAWYSVRGKGITGKLLEALAFAPLAIPHIVMAMAILVLYLRTPLYGTVWVLVCAHVTIYLAFGTRTMTSALLQVHQELEDAARVSGAPWATRLQTIVLPILWPQFLNGWLWVLAHSARDLTVPLVLLSSSNIVVSSLLWMMWEYPNLPGAAALSMMLLVGLIAIVVPVQLYANRGLDLSPRSIRGGFATHKSKQR